MEEKQNREKCSSFYYLKEGRKEVTVISCIIKVDKIWMRIKGKSCATWPREGEEARHRYIATEKQTDK